MKTAYRHSPDRAWWWDGAQWIPAWSADRSHWFDGSKWVPVKQVPRPLTRSEGVVGAAWLVLWVAGVVWAAKAVPAAQVTDSPSAPLLFTGIALIATSSAGIIATSAWLAARRRWALVALFAASVTCLLLAWYVAAMFSVPVPVNQPDTQDDMAGAGVVLLAFPTAGVVVLLSAIGVGIGTLIRHVRRCSDSR